MANTALSAFRTDLQSALGNRGLANATLDRFINYAYLDITGAVDFEVFDSVDDISVTQGNNVYDVPPGALIVKSIFSSGAATDTLLQYVSKEEFYRRDRTTEGTPTSWTRRGAYICLEPNPSGSDTLTVLYKASPTKLSASDSTTEIPELWDPVVWLLAVHYGFLALGEEDRAMVFLQRASVYIQTKITEAEYYAQSLALGMTQAAVRRPELGAGKVQQD